MSQVTGSSGGDLIISGRQIPFAAYQAIYHKITRKVERLSKNYEDGYRIDFANLKNLHERFEQIIQQYNVQGSRCQVSHSAKDGYSNTYSSFQKFEMANFDSADCTSKLHYEFDFLAILPSEVQQARDAAQRFKIEITFHQEFIDPEDPGVPYFFRDLPNIGNLKFELEYSDYAVATAIEATVTQWVGSLPKTKKGRAFAAAFRHELTVNNFFSPLLRLVPLAAGAIGLVRAEDLTAGAAASAILFFLGLSLLAYTFGEFLVRAFYRTLRLFAPSPVILLTKGDRDRVGKIEDTKVGARAALGVIAVTGLLAIAVNICSNWLYERLFH